jgi:hypothetical protein
MTYYHKYMMLCKCKSIMLTKHKYLMHFIDNVFNQSYLAVFRPSRLSAQDPVKLGEWIHFFTQLKRKGE